MELFSAVFVVFIFALFFVSISPAIADMGAIIPAGTVTVDEPGQKAIIAYNEIEEILILSTELEASAPTKALRFIPLPSEPVVSLAPKECFQNLGKLLDTYKMTYLIQFRGAGNVSGNPVELRFHKQLGPHDVTVVRIRDAAHFETWVNEFFANKGLPERRLSPQETEMIADYVNRNFPFFVFDLVELGTNTESIEPLVYRFPTRYFYYPLKTSKFFKKVGSIELFVFDKRRTIQKTDHSRIDGVGYILESSTALVTKNDMQRVAPEIAEVIGNEGLLQAFKYQRVSFTHDVWLPGSPVHEYHAFDPFGRRM